MDSSLNGLPSSIDIFFEQSKRPRSKQSKFIDRMKVRQEADASSLKALHSKLNKEESATTKDRLEQQPQSDTTTDRNQNPTPTKMRLPQTLPAYQLKRNIQHNISTQTPPPKATVPTILQNQSSPSLFANLLQDLELLAAKKDLEFNLKTQALMKMRRESLQLLFQSNENNRQLNINQQRITTQTIERQNRPSLITTKSHQQWATSEDSLTKNSKKRIKAMFEHRVVQSHLFKVKTKKQILNEKNFEKQTLENNYNEQQFLKKQAVQRFYLKHHGLENFMEQQYMKKAFRHARQTLPFHYQNDHLIHLTSTSSSTFMLKI